MMKRGMAITILAVIVIMCLLPIISVGKSDNQVVEITTEKVEQTSEAELLEAGIIESETEVIEPETENVESNLIQSLDFGYEDAEMLEKISIAEAGGESVECMAMVMLVVLNRAWSDEFPNTIKEVLYENKQFTPISNGSYDSAVPNEKSQEALNMIMQGWNESQNALYFESCSGESWHSRNLEYLFQIDNMRFYR
jgi:N-acetylmuramoyl-L-alanine amidase